MIVINKLTIITVRKIIGTISRVAPHRMPSNGGGVRPVDVNCHLLRLDGGTAVGVNFSSNSNNPIITSSREMANIKTAEMAIANTGTDKLSLGYQTLRTTKIRLHFDR